MFTSSTVKLSDSVSVEIPFPSVKEFQFAPIRTQEKTRVITAGIPANGDIPAIPAVEETYFVLQSDTDKEVSEVKPHEKRYFGIEDDRTIIKVVANFTSAEMDSLSAFVKGLHYFGILEEESTPAQFLARIAMEYVADNADVIKQIADAYIKVRPTGSTTVSKLKESLSAKDSELSAMRALLISMGVDPDKLTETK